MRLRHLLPGQRALQGEQCFQCFLFRRMLFRQNSLQKLHRAGALGIAVVMLLFTHGRLKFLSGPCAKLYACPKRTCPAKAGRLGSLTVHILRFQAFIRHALPLEGCRITFLKGYNRPDNGRRLTFDRADDILCRKNNF